MTLYALCCTAASHFVTSIWRNGLQRMLPQAIVIEVLDSASGRPIRQWSFDETPDVRIGRSSDQDVSISDPYVSRHHASLKWDSGRWKLISVGINGVLVANQQIKEIDIDEGTVFRLGAEGPILRFSHATESESAGATMNFNDIDMGAFFLDNSKLESDINEVMNGEFFQQIQQLMDKKRLSGQSDGPTP